MNLDSVRDLKAQFLQRAETAFESTAVIRSLGIRARRSIPMLDEALRTMAMGISSKGQQHLLAIRVQRRSLLDHPLVEQIRKRARGEIDVRYVGRIMSRETSAALQKRRRPLVIGCSIGHFAITAGTLGAFVKDRSTGEQLILSNNHVLADENRGKKGDAIIQQGSIDNGKAPADTVGKLAAFVKLKKRGVNFVDCATATIAAGVACNTRKLGSFGNLAGLGPAVVPDGVAVRKVGRTTGETKGKVTAFELDNVVVEYDLGLVRFDDQIEIEGAGTKAFSAGGDSGSLIFNSKREALALLFAGGDEGGTNDKGLTYGNPIRAVLDALKVDLVL